MNGGELLELLRANLKIKIDTEWDSFNKKLHVSVTYDDSLICEDSVDISEIRDDF